MDDNDDGDNYADDELEEKGENSGKVVNKNAEVLSPAFSSVRRMLGRRLASSGSCG